MSTLKGMYFRAMCKRQIQGKTTAEGATQSDRARPKGLETLDIPCLTTPSHHAQGDSQVDAAVQGGVDFYQVLHAILVFNRIAVNQRSYRMGHEAGDKHTGRRGARKN
jgi:hypothetical protein